MRTSILFFGAISGVAVSAACSDDGSMIVIGAPGDSRGSGASGPAEPAGQGQEVAAGSEPGHRGSEAPGPSGAGLGPSGAGSVLTGADAGGVAAADSGCWQLPTVDRARVLAPKGEPAAIVGGKIMGSNTSAMNDFVELAAIEAAAPDGSWVELVVSDPAPYRYVKYYAPPKSFGALAEVEFYAGSERLLGAGFGTAPAPERGTFARALDGEDTSAFQGALPDDNYVGIDLAAGHLTADPSFEPAPGRYPTAQSVRLGAEPGAQLRFTTDGRDPRTSGLPYTEPVSVATGSTLLRAVATRECAFASGVVQALYNVGERVSSAVSSLHIGNSLTDTIVDRLQPMAQGGAITLDFNRYTIPGAGTWLYSTNPTGGFGVDNVQSALRSRPFDHLSLQPFPNQPCQPAASSDGTDSDAGYINQAWADAKAQNPAVQLWIYQQWPAPQDFSNCMSGGGWTRASWLPPAPASWEDAVKNELSYHEAVRAELVRLNPNDRPPFIVPGGNALVLLKHAIEAGQVPGLGAFFGEIFAANGTDLHLTSQGAYLITAVFYASLFQAEPPAGPADAASGLTPAQAQLFRHLAWQTVVQYPLSGATR